jgi:hypothetical protein
VSHWVRGDVGTQKLELQLRNVKLADSITALFVQIGLYADLRLTGYLKGLQEFVVSIRQSEFFLEALMVKLRDIFIRFGIPKEHERAFAELVAEISADAQGLTGKERSQHLSRTVQDLHQRRQVAKLSSV